MKGEGVKFGFLVAGGGSRKHRWLTGSTRRGCGGGWKKSNNILANFWAKIFKVEDSYAYTDVYVFLYVRRCVEDSYAYTDPRLN